MPRSSSEVRLYASQREEFDIKRMCEVLQVSRSGYYGWGERDESKRSQQDRVLLKEIRKIHQETKEAYGATKTWRTLKQSGMVCGKHRVARLRRQAGIEALRKRRFRLGSKSRNTPLQRRIFYAGRSRPLSPIISG
ncbi:MAG TPA: IS3 family transposase [Pyrinomonadaceae bacterium]|nr:IS3 family transposase [Pyrinomonadaceae bacterium]